jgi:hypothetical protein
VLRIICSFFFLVSVLPSWAAEQHPNIVFILADDMGYGADRKRQYGVELYNLKDDLSEKSNLASEMPEKVESLKAKIGRVLDNSIESRSLMGMRYNVLTERGT